MEKYLIEVPHSADKIECLRAVKIFLNSGSHFLSHADWGCFDGEHKAWLIIDADNKDEIIQMLPPAYRKDAKITLLHKFGLADIEEQLKRHEA